MVTHPRGAVLSAVLALLPGFAGAEDVAATSGSRSGPIIIDVQEQLAQADEWSTQAGEEPTSPPTGPPEESPPPAPSQVPEPPSSEPLASVLGYDADSQEAQQAKLRRTIRLA